MAGPPASLGEGHGQGQSSPLPSDPAIPTPSPLENEKSGIQPLKAPQARLPLPTLLIRK